MVRTYLKLQSFTVGDFTKVSNRGSNESGSSTSDYDCEQHFKVLSGKKMVVYEWSRVMCTKTGRFYRWKVEIMFDNIVRLNLVKYHDNASVLTLQLSHPPFLYGGDQFWEVDRKKRGCCQWNKLDDSDNLSQLMNTYCFHSVRIGNALKKVVPQVQLIGLPYDTSLLYGTFPSLEDQVFHEIKLTKKLFSPLSSKKRIKLPLKENQLPPSDNDRGILYPSTNEEPTRVLAMGPTAARGHLEGLKKNDLEYQLELRGLRKSGKKMDQIERILMYDFSLSPTFKLKGRIIESKNEEELIPVPTFGTPMSVPHFSNRNHGNLLSSVGNLLTPEKSWKPEEYPDGPFFFVLPRSLHGSKNDLETYTDILCETIKPSGLDIAPETEKLPVSKLFQVYYSPSEWIHSVRYHSVWIRPKAEVKLRLISHPNMFTPAPETHNDRCCFVCGKCAETYSMNIQNPIHVWLRRVVNFDVKSLVLTRISWISQIDPQEFMAVCAHGHITFKFCEVKESIQSSNNEEHCKTM